MYKPFVERVCREVPEDEKLTCLERVTFSWAANRKDIGKKHFRRLFEQSNLAWRDLTPSTMLTIPELQALYRSGGVDLTREAIEHLIAPFDVTHDGTFDKYEFFDAYLKVSATEAVSSRGEDVLRRTWEIEPGHGESGTVFSSSQQYFSQSVYMVTIASSLASSTIVRTALAPFSLISLRVSMTTSTPWSLLKDMIKYQGIRSLWKGNVLNVAKNAIYMTSSMLMYDFMYRKFRRNRLDADLSDLGVRGVAGSIAALTGTAIAYPIDSIRTRVTSGLTMRDSLQKRHFFSGVNVAVLETIPSAIVSWTIYDFVFQYVRRNQSADLIVVPAFTAAVVSSFASAFVTYPFILTRRNLQQNPAISTRAFLRWVMKEYGWKGLYRGFGPHITQVTPQNGMVFLLYESFRSILMSSTHQ